MSKREANFRNLSLNARKFYMSLLITNKFKMSAIERGETFIRDVKKLRYTDEYRAIQGAYLVHYAHTCIRWLNSDISCERDSCSKTFTDSIGWNSGAYSSQWKDSICSLVSSEWSVYLERNLFWDSSRERDLVPICADSENFYCYLTSTVITIEKQMEQRMIIFFKRAELSE